MIAQSAFVANRSFTNQLSLLTITSRCYHSRVLYIREDSRAAAGCSGGRGSYGSKQKVAGERGKPKHSGNPTVLPDPLQAGGRRRAGWRGRLALHGPTGGRMPTRPTLSSPCKSSRRTWKANSHLACPLKNTAGQKERRRPCIPNQPGWPPRPEDYERFKLERRHIQQWEDGQRVDTAAPNIEWWYFDTDLDDGAKLAVIFCTKDASRPNQPLEPLIEIDLDLPDGRRLMKYGYYKAEEFSVSKDGCDVRIGPYRFGQPARVHDHGRGRRPLGGGEARGDDGAMASGTATSSSAPRTNNSSPGRRSCPSAR